MQIQNCNATINPWHEIGTRQYPSTFTHTKTISKVITVAQSLAQDDGEDIYVNKGKSIQYKRNFVDFLVHSPQKRLLKGALEETALASVPLIYTQARLLHLWYYYSKGRF